MTSWHPITEEEFSKLFNEQHSELNDVEKIIFDKYRVLPWRTAIRRSQEAGDEMVFVVAQGEDGALHFDDVEYGFNISRIDDTGRILAPGGSQNTLKESMIEWFRASL